MGLTNTGRDYIAQAIMNDTPTFFDNTNAHIGVGNGVTDYAATDTDLVGASKHRAGMEDTFPSRADNVLTFKATFDTASSDFAWEEWGVFNAGPTGGIMLNRKQETLGTKAGGTWVLTVTLTIGIGS